MFWIEVGLKESLGPDFLQIYWLLYGLNEANGEEMVKIDDAVPGVKYLFFLYPLYYTTYNTAHAASRLWRYSSIYKSFPGNLTCTSNYVLVVYKSLRIY